MKIADSTCKQLVDSQGRFPHEDEKFRICGDSGELTYILTTDEFDPPTHLCKRCIDVWEEFYGMLAEEREYMYQGDFTGDEYV